MNLNFNDYEMIDYRNEVIDENKEKHYLFSEYLSYKGTVLSIIKSNEKEIELLCNHKFLDLCGENDLSDQIKNYINQEDQEYYQWKSEQTEPVTHSDFMCKDMPF